MDIVQREGKYPLPPQASKTILGVEFAGTVEKLGEGASMYKVGDEVFGLAYGVSELGVPAAGAADIPDVGTRTADGQVTLVR